MTLQSNSSGNEVFVTFDRISEKCKKSDDRITSGDTLIFSNLEWRVQLFPLGDVNDPERLTVFLILVTNAFQTVECTYKFNINDVEDNRVKIFSSETISSTFEPKDLDWDIIFEV